MYNNNGNCLRAYPAAPSADIYILRLTGMFALDVLCLLLTVLGPDLRLGVAWIST